MKLSLKLKAFYEFVSAFLKWRQNLELFQKKIALIADLFSELCTRKTVVRWMSKKSCFWRPFQKQHGKQVRTLMKSELQHFQHIYWSMWRQFSWEKFLLVIWKMFGLFVNTLTAGHKFSLLNKDRLMKPIQMQLSKKQKAFSKVFFAFLKFR